MNLLSVHISPIKPGLQEQLPLILSQTALVEHEQLKEQFSPYKPSEHSAIDTNYEFSLLNKDTELIGERQKTPTSKALVEDKLTTASS